MFDDNKFHEIGLHKTVLFLQNKVIHETRETFRVSPHHKRVILAAALGD